MTDAVIGVGGYLILRQCAEEDVTGDARGGFLTAGNLEGHGAVDAHHIGAGNGIEQDGDVAVADDPLWVLLELFGGNTVQQMDGSVAAARTDDSLDRVIFKRPYQVGSPFVGCSGVGIDVQVVGVWTNDRLQPPAPDRVCCLLQGLLRHPIGGRHKCNLVTFLQIRWLNHLFTLVH